MSFSKVEITHGGDTVTMYWDQEDGAAPIFVDGSPIGYRTVDARYRTVYAVVLVCRRVWPEAAWPAVPQTGGNIPFGWGEGFEAWDALAYDRLKSE